MRRFVLFLPALALLSGAAYAQAVATDSPFQVGFVSNLNKWDTDLNVTNTGANGSAGKMCVNVYAMNAATGKMAPASCTAS